MSGFVLIFALLGQSDRHVAAFSAGFSGIASFLCHCVMPFQPPLGGGDFAIMPDIKLAVCAEYRRNPAKPRKPFCIMKGRGWRVLTECLECPLLAKGY
jgi:hypothetical protein